MPDDYVSQIIQEAFDILREVVEISIVLVYCLCLIFDLPLTAFWIFLSAVALLSHLILNKIQRHAYTEISYEMYMNIIKMDFFGVKDTFNDWLFEQYEFTSSGAFNSVFYTMGYTSKNSIANIGPINYICIAVFVCILIQIIFLPKACMHFDCTRGMAIRGKKFQPQTFLIRFFQLFFLTLPISAIIPLTNQNSEDGFTFLDTEE